jgi:hypothetical protein
MSGELYQFWDGCPQCPRCDGPVLAGLFDRVAVEFARKATLHEVPAEDRL